MAEHPERHSLLALPAWGVVPGARFREVYYWDSLWVVRGLLVSRMPVSARARPCRRCRSRSPNKCSCNNCEASYAYVVSELTI